MRSDNGIAAPTCKNNLTQQTALHRFANETTNFTQAIEFYYEHKHTKPTGRYITNIVSGDVVSEIIIGTAAGEITSIITTGSVKRMNLKHGDNVFAIIKATEVSVEKE